MSLKARERIREVKIRQSHFVLAFCVFSSASKVAVCNLSICSTCLSCAEKRRGTNHAPREATTEMTFLYTEWTVPRSAEKQHWLKKDETCLSKRFTRCFVSKQQMEGFRTNCCPKSPDSLGLSTTLLETRDPSLNADHYTHTTVNKKRSAGPDYLCPEFCDSAGFSRRAAWFWFLLRLSKTGSNFIHGISPLSAFWSTQRELIENWLQLLVHAVQMGHSYSEIARDQTTYCFSTCPFQACFA